MKIVYHVFRRSSSEGPLFSFRLFSDAPLFLLSFIVFPGGGGCRICACRNDAELFRIKDNRALDNRLRNRYIVLRSLHGERSVFDRKGSGSSGVFLTFVGMIRRCSVCSSSRKHFPHISGDDPDFNRDPGAVIPFSPRKRGWSADRECCLPVHHNFPTQVGMIRWIRIHGTANGRFPTQMGMIRRQGAARPGRDLFPHVCGDGPAMADGNWNVKAFSPLRWGWSEQLIDKTGCARVSPLRWG